jgi:hypothetical protein
MADAALDRDLDQRARLDGIVEVVAQWIGNRVRDHDGAGKMNDGTGCHALHDAPDQGLIADIAFDVPACLGTARARPVERLSRTTTGSPASSSSSAIWLPIYPAPPVTRTLMC